MSYTPNPYDAAQPTEDKFVVTAAAEFRAMKSALTSILVGLNYIGEWSDLVVGSSAVAGSFVTHNENLWMLRVALVDVRSVEPTETNLATWFRVAASGSDGMFKQNGQLIDADFTLVTGKNASTVGPVTINDGVTVTVEDGANWVVI